MLNLKTLLAVLLALCAFFSFKTVSDQPVEGAAGANEIAAKVLGQAVDGADKAVLLIAAGTSPMEEAFVAELHSRCAEKFRIITARDPGAARAALQENPKTIAASAAAGNWLVFDPVREKVIAPKPLHRWPNFLKLENLRNIASQIAVIAILAVGMTLVILTGGIDLSVGSLVAFTSVCAAWMIAHGPGNLYLAAGTAILAGAIAGAINGSLVAWARVPAFIATLAMMLIARGLAFKIGDGQSIGSIPGSFGWLGMKFTLGLPNLGLLMAVIYLIAHVLMTRTVLGRHIYAIGANTQAALFSGISVARVRLFVFVASGALAGLAGVAMTSQLLSGDPNVGRNYELTAIAAAVVGGTSLTGGRGAIFGTLAGALILGVLENGLKQIGLDEYDQMLVLGTVILLAVLADGFTSRRKRFQSE